MTDLKTKHCVPCEGGIPPLNEKAIHDKLKALDGWDLKDSHDEIMKDFQFNNFYHTMNFVNAIAWIANQEGHHPDLEVGYNHCLVRYSTHAIGGLSDNDFICATRVDALLI